MQSLELSERLKLAASGGAARKAVAVEVGGGLEGDGGLGAERKGALAGANRLDDSGMVALGRENDIILLEGTGGGGAGAMDGKGDQFG
jgi:hypothetical protein